MLSPYQDKQFYQVRRAMVQKYSQTVIEEQDLLIRQIQLLKQCKQKLQRRKAYDSMNNFSLNITSISSIPNMQYTEDSSFRNKFTQQFQNSILNAAVREVRTQCSEQTFDTVMGCIMNSKGKQYDQARKEIEKKNRQIQQLSALIIIKQKDINFMERDLASLRVKEEYLDQQKKKIKRKADLLDQKQIRLHNAQMSLIFKEKLNQQAKRRYQRQKQTADATLAQLNKSTQQLQAVWQLILSKMQASRCECDTTCWRQQVMRKCKEQLVDQRKALQDQAAQIENQYEIMRNLSDQINRACAINTQTHKNAATVPNKA